MITWQSSLSPSDRKVLLLKRHDHDGGFWQPVTGGVDTGEDYSEAALRECQEETGLQPDSTAEYMGLEHCFQGRWGPAIERAFRILYFCDIPPTPALDGKEHSAFQWEKPAKAIQLLPHEHAKEAVRRATDSLNPFTLKKDGSWWQEGEEITHERTISFLHSNITKLNKSWWVVDNSMKQPVFVEEDAIFIHQVDLDTVTLRTLADKPYPFQPNDLFITKEGILKILINGMPATFLKNVYYKLTQFVTQEKNSQGELRYIFHFQNKAYCLPINWCGDDKK